LGDRLAVGFVAPVSQANAVVTGAEQELNLLRHPGRLCRSTRGKLQRPARIEPALLKRQYPTATIADFAGGVFQFFEDCEFFLGWVPLFLLNEEVGQANPEFDV